MNILNSSMEMTVLAFAVSTGLSRAARFAGCGFLARTIARGLHTKDFHVGSIGRNAVTREIIRITAQKLPPKKGYLG